MLFEPDGLVISVRSGESILMALQREGYTHAVGCRRGGCGRCKVLVESGRVDYSTVIAHAVLTSSERAGGWCLTCRAEPASDVVVRLKPQDRLVCLIPWLKTAVKSSWAKPTVANKEPPK